MRNSARARRAPLRVLVLSHMHPRASRGGAEIAAYQLYGALKDEPGVEAWFLAAGGGRFPERLGARFQQPFGPDEFVYTGAGFDHWLHANPDPEFPADLTALLEELRPDVVHLHHYANFGVETLLHIRRALPRARVVRADRVGKDGNTVRAFLEGEGGGRLKAICFRAKEGPLAQALLNSGGAPLHLCGPLRAERWNDAVTACLHVVDAAPVPAGGGA